MWTNFLQRPSIHMHQCPVSSLLLQGAATNHEPRVPARLQRKVARKASFLQKVADSKALAATAKVHKKTSSRRTTLNLDALSAMLPTLPSAQTPKSSTSNSPKQQAGVNKRRAKLLQKEAVRLQAVLQHPQYQADPFVAVTQHLNSMLPTPPVAKSASNRQIDPAAAKRARRQRNKERKKAGAGIVGMQH